VRISTLTVQQWIGIALIPSLFYSTALTTACIACFFFLSLFRISGIKSCPWYIWIWTLVWFQALFSGINTEQYEIWKTNVFLKLPFLLMPLAFYVLPRFSKRYIYNIHLWLLLVLWASAVPVLINYYLHQGDFLSKLSMGQAIPTPIHHVLYSMIMSYAILATGYILIKNKEEYQDWRLLIMCGTIGLFIVQHVLAVRTGLLISYISIPVMIWLSMKKKAAVFYCLIIILGAGLVGIKMIPSLKHRVAYMTYDLEQFRSGKGGSYADSERLYSLQSGIKLWQEKPLIGVGIGDLRTEMRAAGIDKLPHSQWVTTMAGSGLIGLMLMSLGLFIPFYKYKGEFKGLLILLYLNLIVCMTLDFVLEHSVIIAFINFFGLMFITSER